MRQVLFSDTPRMKYRRREAKQMLLQFWVQADHAEGCPCGDDKDVLEPWVRHLILDHRGREDDDIDLVAGMAESVPEPDNVEPR